MKILIVNNVFHSVMPSNENDPPASQVIEELTYTSETVEVTNSLKVFYPGCIWNGSYFSEPTQNQLVENDIIQYWQDVELRITGEAND